MLKTRIVQPSTFQWLVNENSGWWKVISRKAPGQDYCWVVINGDEPRIGPVPSGVLSDNDWSTTADHWSSNRPYRAYIPVTPNSDNFPARGWVSDWSFNNHAGWGLTLDARRLIFRVRDNARKMMQAVLSTYMPKYIIPPSLSLGWLDGRFPTEEALAEKVAEAQRHVLDQYGFIAFNIKRDPTWRTRTALSTLQDMIINTGLTECAYRGCIVDLKRVELSEMMMLIEDKVPLHYQWFPTDVGPFNPRALKASDYDLCKETTQEEHFILHLSNARTFYRVSSGGDKVAISKREFRRWAYWCTTKHLKLPSGDVYLLFQDVQHTDSGPDDLTLVDMEDIQPTDSVPDGPTVVNVDELSDYSSDDEGETTELETQKTFPAGVTLGIATAALSQSELDAADAFLSVLRGVVGATIQQEPHDQAPQSPITLEEDTTITSCSPLVSQMREDASAPCLPLPAVPFPTRMPDRETESPPHDERGILLENGSSRKRTISTISSPSKTRENKRHCADQQLTPLKRPTGESSTSRDVDISHPSAIEQPTLPDRIHDVMTFPPAPVPQVLSQL